MSGGSAEPEGPHDRECPHCGKYYRDQGNSFNLHTGACDGASDGTSTRSGTDSGTDSNASESDTEPNEPTSDNGTDGTSENPLHDGPEPDPPSSDSGGTEYPAEVREGCPQCGGELIDMRDQETVTREGVMYDTPDEYYCSECGQGFNYREE